MEVTATQAPLPEENGMLHMTIKEAQINLAEIVQQVAAEDKRVILTQDGKAIAAIISIEAFDFLERMVEKIEDEIDIEDSLAALAEAEEKGTISLEQLKAELDL